MQQDKTKYGLWKTEYGTLHAELHHILFTSIDPEVLSLPKSFCTLSLPNSNSGWKTLKDTCGSKFEGKCINVIIMNL